MSQTMIKKQLNKIKDLAKQAKSDISDINLDESISAYNTLVDLIDYVDKLKEIYGGKSNG